jgi:DNA-binding transcriptional LysR family regulator
MLRGGRARMHNLATFDWSDLRYFLAVAREGSSLAAARALRVNQSTVHRRLAELEKRLGCPLVERRPSGYRLTEYGEELRPYAERVEQAASALRRHAATFDKGMRGTVRVTCSTTIAHRLMRSALLDEFHKRYPGIKIELLMTDRVLDLSNDEADIAIRGGAAREEALVGKKIADVPWAIYASRSYIQRNGRPRSPEDLRSHYIIEFTGEIANLAAARWLQSKASQASISGQASNVPSVLLAVKSGGGLSLLPSPLADLDQDLVRVIGPIPEVNYPIYLFTHRDLRRIPRIALFFDYCLSRLRPVLTGSEPRKTIQPMRR